MKSESVELLVETIDQEHECCQKLIDVSATEQQSLVQSDLDGIQAGIAAMQRTVGELQRLQSRRAKLIATLENAFGGVGESKNDGKHIERLATRLSAEDAARLRRSHRRLADTSGKLYRTNQQTIYLIEFSLNLVDGQVAAWRSSLVAREGYGDDGQACDRRSEVQLFEDKA